MCRKIQKEVISRQIHLVPNQSSLEDHAAITFCHDGEFLYQITITGILQEETKGLISHTGTSRTPYIPMIPTAHIDATSQDVTKCSGDWKPYCMGCRFTIYSLFMDIHYAFMDIHNSFMDMHNSFMDILN